MLSIEVVCLEIDITLKEYKYLAYLATTLRRCSYATTAPYTGHAIAILVETKGLGKDNVNKPNEIAKFQWPKNEDFYTISQGETVPPMEQFN